jgi:Domain of unknown function (DUF4129)
VLLAGLLILLVIFGIRALPAIGWTSSWHGPWYHEGTAIAIGAEAALAVLLGWLLRLRKRPQASWRANRLRAWLAVVLPAAMILSGTALLRFLSLHGHSTPRVQLRSQAPKLRHKGQGLAEHWKISPEIATIIEYAVLAMIIISLLIATFILLSRLRRATRRERLVVSADEADVVREAVEAGRTALTGVSDARMAIIACYLAMERSLGQAGTARAAAETADELLARATAAGLLHGAAPAELTALFYEARFSRHDVPEGARTRALAALDVIVADLSAPERDRSGPPRPGTEAVAP